MLGAHIAAVEQYAFAVERNRFVASKFSQARRSVAAASIGDIRDDPGGARRNRDRTIHRAGVQVGEAERARECARDGDLPAPTGPSIATMGAWLRWTLRSLQTLAHVGVRVRTAHRIRRASPLRSASRELIERRRETVSSAARIASRLVRQISRHISADDAAIRVVSRRPPAPYSAASLPSTVHFRAPRPARSRRAAADGSRGRGSRRGRQAPSARRCAPVARHSASTLATASGVLRADGVTITRRLTNRFSSAARGAGDFLAGHRMNADQRHPRTEQRLEFAHHPTLDAADVGDDASPAADAASSRRAFPETSSPASRASPGRRRARPRPDRAWRNRSCRAPAQRRDSPACARVRRSARPGRACVRSCASEPPIRPTPQKVICRNSVVIAPIQDSTAFSETSRWFQTSA